MEKIYLDIDGTDFTTDYGLTVAKGTIESFLTYPQFKQPKQNDWAEYDGIEIDLSAPVFKNRTIMLNVTCRTACFNELIDTLTDGVYHDITFEPFGLEFSYCRYTSVSKVSKLNDMVDATINITIDDVPFDNYIPAVPSTREYTGEYNLEGKSFVCPLTISYEYDPCDWLKAAEFQLKRDNPDYVKSEQADLDNMKTGIFGFKGHLHYQVSAPIDSEIAALDSSVPRNQFLDQVAQIIDNHIFKGYRIYPCNRIALDMLRGDNAQAGYYTPEQKQEFQTYLDGQLAKIDIPNPDWDYLRERILTMYANPLINYLNATKQQ